ncbi:hypothetical protein BASA81_008832 [Batrachochytrium salamandrivorans]|nr:hypothetical protein BASA81_008832 [Batrachochytrium salamandrivorans]
MIPGLPLQALVAFPLLTFIVTTKRLARPHRYALGLLATAGLIALQYYWLQQNWEANYFEVLQVPTWASGREIKAAFRKLSMESHPDRGGSEEAFLLISKAHTVLVNDELREAYNRWGKLGLEWAETNQSALVNGWVSLAVSLVVHFVLVFMATVSVSDTNARSYGFGLLGLFMAVAMELRFGQDDPLALWSTRTRDEKYSALFNSLGTLLVCLCVFQRAVYKDVELDWKLRLERIEQQQALLLQRAFPRKDGEEEEEAMPKVKRINI